MVHRFVKILQEQLSDKNSRSMLTISTDGFDSGWFGADRALTTDVKDGALDVREMTVKTTGLDTWSTKSFITGFDEMEHDSDKKDTVSSSKKMDGQCPCGRR